MHSLLGLMSVEDGHIEAFSKHVSSVLVPTAFRVPTIDITKSASLYCLYAIRYTTLTTAAESSMKTSRLHYTLVPWNYIQEIPMRTLPLATTILSMGIKCYCIEEGVGRKGWSIAFTVVQKGVGSLELVALAYLNFTIYNSNT